MRSLFALACLGLAAAVPAAAQSAAWSFVYDGGSGLATATMRDDGDVAVTFTCQAPAGEIMVSDFTLGRGRASTATIRIGEFSMNVPSRVERVGRKRALVIPLPQSPPVLAAVGPDRAMTISAGGRSHTLAPGAGERLREVAYNCWSQGS